MRQNQTPAKFQNFNNASDGAKGAERLAALRKLMAEQRLDAWLVPHADSHQNEYPPKNAWRLAWLTGFTGSAGYCIVTHDQAVVFVDGRYTAQVAQQIDADHFTTADLVECPPHQWLQEWSADEADKGQPSTEKPRIGFDPWITTISAKSLFLKSLKDTQAEMISATNLIDAIWLDQPATPGGSVSIQDVKFSGVLASEKINRLKAELADQDAALCLLCDLASIAWLFNIRGNDTPHTPLVLAYAIIRSDDFPLLFIDKHKLSYEEEAYLTQLADIHPYENLSAELAKLVDNNRLLTDFSKTSVAVADIVSDNGGTMIKGSDPVLLPRAIKNRHEIEGSRQAHLRDGVAVTKFLYWLDQQQPGTIDEISAVIKLENLRVQTAEQFDSELKDISFDSISGAGANGAVIHYRVTHESNALLDNNALYLIDSGGQYQDGTTDITRTIAIGSPPARAIEDFTLVLKGHIAIALARFPVGTRGVDLDSFARSALWQHGRDFAHGTGHGIGSYLSVHEGPQSISRRSQVALEPGMILSNEPGFYRDGQWGIRIENLILVEQPEEIPGGNIEVMGFETLSMAPIDLRLVDAGMLDHSERHWLNAYHRRVRQQLSPHLSDDEAKWLEKATAPLSDK